MSSTTAFEGRNWKNWTEPTFVDVDGVSTAYRRGGTGPTLVYLHGGGGTREWAPIHRALSENFDVIAPEHPGFGDTDRPEDLDTWQDFILHYDAFFRALELRDFHLVGTSLGAWLAANIATTYPDRFRSLTLVTPLGARIEDEPFIDLFRMSDDDEAAAMFNGRQDRYIDDLVQEGGLDDVIHAFHEQTTCALLMWNPRYELKFDRRLRRVTIPTLVVGAEDDRVVGNLQAERFATLIPQASLVTLRGPDGEPSGHGIPIEQPGDLARAISSHIDSLA